MKADTKPASGRFGLAPAIALAAALALPLASVVLTGIATPASAKDGVQLAPVVPASVKVVPGTLAEGIDAVVSEPAFQKVGAGMASYYGKELAGNRTANGERFNPSALTAAHRTLPLGSKVRVTNPRTGSSVIVRINDRGPFHSSRLIDLSEAAAREVGIRSAGRGMVEISVPAE